MNSQRFIGPVWQITALHFSAEAENNAAFTKHMTRTLQRFRRVIILNLVDSGLETQEYKLVQAYIRLLLLLNNPNLTYVGFDFHEYCPIAATYLTDNCRGFNKGHSTFDLHRTAPYCRLWSMSYVITVPCVAKCYNGGQ
ncbi:unnamed protein product, partial [Dibothriocephalus latus]